MSGYIKQSIIGVAIILFSILVVAPPDHYLFCMLNALALNFFFLFLIFSGILFLLKKKVLALLILYSCLYLGLEYPFPKTEMAIIGKHEDLRVMHLNVLKWNKNYISIVDAIRKSKAHFISLQEVTPPLAKILTDSLSTLYPYSEMVPECSSFGIAVLSKLPLKTSIEIWEGIPNITGSILLDNREIKFLASHTIPPTTSINYRMRNQHILIAGEYLQQIDEPKLAIGDYNAVPWDSIIMKYQKKAGISDSRKQLTSTYPGWLSLGKIPIDYIFHSEQIACTSLKAINSSSSDHLGLIGDYVLLN